MFALFGIRSSLPSENPKKVEYIFPTTNKIEFDILTNSVMQSSHEMSTSWKKKLPSIQNRIVFDLK